MAPQRIALFGGSFDPPHDGHLYISGLARGMLRADEVRWIPALGNPLKTIPPAHGYSERLALCRELTQAYNFVRISDIERRTRSGFAIDTIAYALQKEPGARFVWMMGSDCVENFHRWRKWRHIVETVPIAIFARHEDWRQNMARAPLLSLYRRYIYSLAPEKLFLRNAPAIQIIATDCHPASSSAIRAHKKSAT